MSVPAGLVDALAAKVRAMSPPERLRLAATLLEERLPTTSLAIIRIVVHDLEVALALAGRRN